MRDLDQIKAILAFIAFEIGLCIGLLWTVIAG